MSNKDKATKLVLKLNSVKDVMIGGMNGFQEAEQIIEEALDEKDEALRVLAEIAKDIQKRCAEYERLD